MLGSRTVKTLTALLGSMTLGAFVLMVLETAPTNPEPEQLAAVTERDTGLAAIIRDTAVPLQRIKWRNVVVHGSGVGSSDIAGRCHFVVGQDGRIIATALWKHQLAGYHVYVPGRDFNADSIGICLDGDFSDLPPARAQFEVLVNLTRAIQEDFAVPPDRVYLHSQLDARSSSPGAAFPAAALDGRLYRQGR